MKKLRTRQGPLPHLCELSGERELDAINARGTTKAKCGTHALVHHFSSKGKAHKRKFPLVVEVYLDPTVVVLQIF